ncbi:MAG: hypothetical protein WCP86_04345 [bacterium]
MFERIAAITRPPQARAAWMACSLGLALLTKGTAGIFAAPFLLYFFVRAARISWRHATGSYLLVGVIILSIITSAIK